MIRQIQTGFTLVELIMAIVAFGFIAAGLAVLFATVTGVQQESSYTETATRAAQTEIESLRNNKYSQLQNGNIDFSSQLPNYLPAPRSGTVTVSQPTPGIKRVDVVVSFTDYGNSKSIELSSLIGVIGITD